MSLKLYSVSDGPPSLAVRQGLKALGVDYTLINVDFGLGEHMTDEYAKMNPQKEIPVLDDDGFMLSESNAILQYLADKYGKDDKLYPKDPKARAVVNQRLCFNMSTYYRSISEHVVSSLISLPGRSMDVLTSELRSIYDRIQTPLHRNVNIGERT
ncbi:PREDICTED: glutathione S-transferase 1-like, partial [Nicrophorus vespilloides]|uniref:Glutathione S-transferase 1-like n=1 Tax=Nicrophorus vespilloides TaxID=110193 RepID=A0ABM1M469_NICVS